LELVIEIILVIVIVNYPTLGPSSWSLLFRPH